MQNNQATLFLDKMYKKYYEFYLHKSFPNTVVTV